MNHLLKLITICVIVLYSCPANAQNVTNIVSTGNTTGHIATLTVTNPGNQPVLFKLGMALIPSKEFKTSEGIHKSQPQIHTGNIEQEIAPGETVEIPVTGFCLDVHKPALPAGASFPPYNDWVLAIPTSPEVVNPMPNSGGVEKPKNAIPTAPQPGQDFALLPGDKLPSGYKLSDTKPAGSTKWNGPEAPFPPNDGPLPKPPRPNYLTYPGTDQDFKYTINISENPEDASLMIFPMVNKIISSYHSLHSSGLISTPFSANEEAEYNAVVQQTVWMATSLLQGEPYTKADFTERMSGQFEEASGVKIDEAPEEQQKQFTQGIDQFWGAFELVGEKAKVIKPVFIDEELSKGNCPCDECEVVTPLRILNNETNEEITSDTIVWGKYELRIEPQQVRSNCPEECSPENINGFDLTLGNFSVKMNRPYILRKLDHQQEGRMLIISNSLCKCEGRSCGENTTEKVIYFSKNCCEELRHGQNSNWRTGYLNFDMGNGQFVHIDQNSLFISVIKNGRPIDKRFDFNVNIESILCDLEDNEVYQNLNTQMLSQSQNSTVINETLDASSLGFAGPTADAEGSDPSYTFRFMKSVSIDGELTEVEVSIKIDKATCTYMVQVLFDNEIYEAGGRPLYSFSGFMQQLNNLGSPHSGYYWNRLRFLYTECLKYQNGQQDDLMNSLKEKIEAGLNSSNLPQSEKNALKAKLNDMKNIPEIISLLQQMANPG